MIFGNTLVPGRIDDSSIMDNMLRCNSLKCRKELRDRALVTTCSHIFCTDCAARLGLTGQRHEQRNSCPACRSDLTNPDDAVVTNLKPSEDYKTSVLSGLSPNVIIECASRALSFWAYQSTQEVSVRLPILYCAARCSLTQDWIAQLLILVL